MLADSEARRLGPRRSTFSHLLKSDALESRSKLTLPLVSSSVRQVKEPESIADHMFVPLSSLRLPLQLDTDECERE